jgi:hypothetical protein
MKHPAFMYSLLSGLMATAAVLLICNANLQAWPAATQAPSNQGTFFPLTPGTTWVYRGSVTWFNPEKEQNASSDVMLTTKVEKVIHKPGITFAILSGFPADLDWSSGEVEPKPFLLVETDQHEVFLDPLPPDFDYSKLEKDSTPVKPFLAEDNLFFRWPLKKGMKFGDPEQLKREDNEYCWFVNEQSAKELRDIQGLTPRRAEVSVLRFVTNPDDTTMDVVWGIGVLSYEYHHHGSTADTSVRLVEFHPGSVAAAATGAAR